MKKLLILIAISLLAIPFIRAEEKKLNILTTTPDLKSITEEIGGKYVNVTSICLGNQDPHFVEAKPSIIAYARKADLFIVIGLELEVGYEALIIEGSRNTKIKPGTDGYLDVSEGVLLLEVPTCKIDRSMGDVHPYGNPHYWLDPYNIRIIAQNISNRLQKIDSAHPAEYQTNYQTFVKKIDEAMFGVQALAKVDGDKLWEMELSGKLEEFIKEHQLQLDGWKRKVQSLRGMKIAIFHRSWSYFTNRFGLVVGGEVEPKPGIPPGPRHLKDLIKKIKLENVKVILMEPFYDRKSSDFVADKTSAKVVVSPISVGGEPAVKDYISFIDTLTNRLLEAITIK
jgi:ABC-type Zn uptake system ZnuABC Zn-binding protein ZnuA